MFEHALRSSKAHEFPANPKLLEPRPAPCWVALRKLSLGQRLALCLGRVGPRSSSARALVFVPLSRMGVLSSARHLPCSLSRRRPACAGDASDLPALPAGAAHHGRVRVLLPAARGRFAGGRAAVRVHCASPASWGSACHHCARRGQAYRKDDTMRLRHETADPLTLDTAARSRRPDADSTRARTERGIMRELHSSNKKDAIAS